MYLGLYRLQVVGVSAGSRLWRPRNKRLQRISQPSRFGFPHLGFAPGLSGLRKVSLLRYARAAQLKIDPFLLGPRLLRFDPSA